MRSKAFPDLTNEFDTKNNKTLEFQVNFPYKDLSRTLVLGKPTNNQSSFLSPSSKYLNRRAPQNFSPNLTNLPKPRYNYCLNNINSNS